MKILWVENHKAFVTIALKSILSAHDVTVTPTLTGARAAFACDRFDAILVDFDLDDGKGNELVKEIAADDKRPIIVACSSHAEGNAQLIRAAADAVCSKMKFQDIDFVLEIATQTRSSNRGALAGL